jgi:hypothetical protein
MIIYKNLHTLERWRELVSHKCSITRKYNTHRNVRYYASFRALEIKPDGAAMNWPLQQFGYFGGLIMVVSIRAFYGG